MRSSVPSVLKSIFDILVRDYYITAINKGVIGMSQHSSLKSSSKITAKRNVLKRFERINILKGKGKWKDGDRGVGLPKTKE
jgi:small basic protein (TIGR04137 family)